MKANDTRLDSVRCMAILSVLFCHCVESVFWFTLPKITALPPWTCFWELEFFTLGRLGVPLFLFLTGYLMIPKSYEGPALSRFYRTRFLPLLLCWECWILLYWLINAGTGRIPWSLSGLIQQLLLLKPVDMMHGWYMPMILGMYLFLPYISFGVRMLPGRLLIAMTALGFFSWMVLPCVNRLAQISGSSLWLSWLPDLTAGGGLYGVYLLTGYLLHRYREGLRAFFSRPWIRAAALLCAAALAGLTGWVQLRAFRSFHEFRIWYDWPLLPVIGLLLWAVACGAPTDRPRRLTASLADHAFGMYLVHMPIILLLVRFRPFGFPRFLYLGLLFLLTLILSWLTAMLGSRIPHLGRLLFYRK